MASPDRAAPKSSTSGHRAERAADAVWRRLCDGVTAEWLEEIRGLRTNGDDFEASMDIWTVALTAELKNPTHKDDAAEVLGRLQHYAHHLEGTVPAGAD